MCGVFISGHNFGLFVLGKCRVCNVNATFVSLSAALQRPVINDKGEFTAWQADPATSECKNRLLSDLSAFCSCVIVIERSKGQAVKAKADQKRKLKETADNAMQVDDDGKAEAQRIQRIVDHQVAASLKKLSLGNGKGNALQKKPIAKMTVKNNLPHSGKPQKTSKKAHNALKKAQGRGNGGPMVASSSKAQGKGKGKK
ncbi:hypothetical protein M405DRAFT_868055 [Rhizopogon salebrosus TDB-379]|nr:hypothetical protein M405DRAFT_868055 [Rhizopogon salebrosus TDB-379]